MLAVSGLLVLAVFVALLTAERLIVSATDPGRLRLSFPAAEGTSLAAELCQDGSARDFAVSASAEPSREPYFETTARIDAHACATVDIPMPARLPDERPARIRIRAEDTDGRILEIFRML